MLINSHGYDGCVRAFNALADVHAAVAAQLTATLEAEVDLSINEFDTLLFLSLQPDGCLPLTGLREPVRLSQPAISRLVDRLEHRGLVRRDCGTADRRNVLVILTEQGGQVLARALPIHAKGVSELLLSPLTPEECAVFKTIMMKIMAKVAVETKPELV